ncbi:DMT family transporter [Roseococcus suduntuyensis]|uniref:Drug/metabolite transporter (DMT)-like permease n=1 Tax=Roseococcus suduntuyensis TaxID=455361 RepID=A0A840AC73_9PROT|nr:DMT family transporter [Roseococcus suduntuyensis]MBB3898502.1 drug/metabolite transporter (DMT)-like permease [Roseococcus suduntuyensis]
MRFASLPGNLRGAILMSLGTVLFAVEVLFIRWMNDRGIPTTTQVFARSMGQLLWVLPLILGAGLAVFRTHRLGLHLFRGLASALTWGLYFLSFAFLDLATATVLSFTNVMFTTLLAGPILRERVDAARWAGTLLGLLGVAIMLRPGTDIPLLGALTALGAALAWCGITLSSRALSRTESTQTVVAWVGIVTSLCTLPFFLWGWAPIGLGDAAILLVFALFTPGIIWFVTEALRAGEASAVAPFQYLRLVVIMAFGWVLFAEVPDGWTLLGAAVILTGAVVITVREARRA